MLISIINNIVLAIKSFNPLVAILIFFFYMIIDALSAKYTISVSESKEYKAAFSSVAIYFLTAYGVINYTQNWLYIFPLVTGAWLGTFCTIRKERKKLKNVSK